MSQAVRISSHERIKIYIHTSRYKNQHVKRRIFIACRHPPEINCWRRKKNHTKTRRRIDKEPRVENRFSQNSLSDREVTSTSACSVRDSLIAHVFLSVELLLPLRIIAWWDIYAVHWSLNFFGLEILNI